MLVIIQCDWKKHIYRPPEHAGVQDGVFVPRKRECNLCCHQPYLLKHSLSSALVMQLSLAVSGHHAIAIMSHNAC